VLFPDFALVTHKKRCKPIVKFQLAKASRSRSERYKLWTRAASSGLNSICRLHPRIFIGGSLSVDIEKLNWLRATSVESKPTSAQYIEQVSRGENYFIQNTHSVEGVVGIQLLQPSTIRPPPTHLRIPCTQCKIPLMPPPPQKKHQRARRICEILPTKPTFIYQLWRRLHPACQS
jgi:hypothetical protein